MAALARAAPALFVLLWSSAFVGAKYGLPHAEPLTFMWLRFVAVTAIFAALALAFRAPWPATWREAGHIAFVGLLVQGIYLSGTFVAIDRGASVGLASLILGLQPVLTVLAASALPGGGAPARQWGGVLLGFAGLVLFLRDKIDLGEAAFANVWPLCAGLLCITAGTMHQRRHCARMNLLTGAALQSAVAMAATGLGAWLLEDMEFTWNADFAGALAWQVVVVSLGAHTLLLFLLRHGEATRVASLFFLVPPTAAGMAFLVFGETLGAAALAGVAITAAGVALATRDRAGP